MGIDNYMTPYEAAHRWKISYYKINRVLANRSYIQKDLDNKTLKYFQIPDSKRCYWVIHIRAMERWYGPEPKY